MLLNIFARTIQFCKKILPHNKASYVHMLVTKYRCFQYSITYCSQPCGSDTAFTKSTQTV